MKTNYLNYLKDMLEGNADVRFRIWFRDNSVTLKSSMSGPQYSRLKFDPVRGAKEQLDLHKISYQENQAAILMEKILFQFSIDMLNEHGGLKKDALGKLIPGFDSFHKNDIARARKEIFSYLNKRQKNSDFLHVEVEELIALLNNIMSFNFDFFRFSALEISNYFKSINVRNALVEKMLAISATNGVGDI